jgi:UDP-N-acetylmuramoyl-tripeptide--D-alanyl-D-alanine ligase
MVAPVNPRRTRADAEESMAMRRSGGRGSWLTAAAVARVAGGEVLRRGGSAHGVTTDTRGDCLGRLFVALRGDQHDGHTFLAAAAARGAAGLVVDARMGDTALAAALEPLGRVFSPFVVRVPDTGRALLDLAGEHRRRHRAKVVGITGSCGKTTTKEWLGTVLGRAMATVRSPASFNNQIGVPLTLFSIEPETRAAVVEIGTNAPGEIGMLSAVARPDLGIVTCVAPAHLEGLGSLDGVAREKSALPAALPEDGLCLLNGDDAACRAMAEVARAKVQFVGIDHEADWFATDVQFHGLGTSFRLQGERLVTLPVLGTHAVYNALLVIAAASHLGVAEQDVLQALAAVPAAARRLEAKVRGGVTVYDDTYNMNPESARAALHALAGTATAGRRIAVFGAMLELGAASEALHERLGAEVARTRQDLLVCVGEGAEPIARGAVRAGMSAVAVHVLPGPAEALALLRAAVRPGDVVLAKASRRIGLDRLVDQLLEVLGAEGAPAEGSADA